jgi:hypothetical protein
MLFERPSKPALSQQQSHGNFEISLVEIRRLLKAGK